ncbi:DUF3558 domain-containing protein [Saccharothrix variisporea]|uniref:Uncharacterized protein DUF3558 n=1 Tax=Saccharothrix variisporea TaxID=543527 RepID=A0A495XEY8_9PSEU|nr:DUF3558 domain-containing protein [Saccharothrix variisporea]RKT71796.1 uncharacterized protein DUF3558 [Saccharothrix variisporea]
MRRAVPLLAAVLLLAGCSESTTGSPTAGSPTGETTASSGKPTSTSKEPAKRPKTINLKDVDPCTLLTDAQRKDIGLDRPPLAGTSTVFRSPSCSFNREDRTWGATVTTATTSGIEFYTDGSFDVEMQRLQVAGFPAVLGGAPDQKTSCYAAVDVSDGQVLALQATSIDEKVPQGRLCELVQQVAAATVATLSAR